MSAAADTHRNAAGNDRDGDGGGISKTQEFTPIAPEAWPGMPLMQHMETASGISWGELAEKGANDFFCPAAHEILAMSRSSAPKLR